MRSLRLAARRTRPKVLDILQCLASHLPMPAFHVRSLLLGDGAEVRNDGKLLVREPFRTESAVEGDHCWLMGFGRRIAGRMGSSDSDGRAKPRVNCNAMMDGDSCSRRRQNGGGCT